MMHPGSSHLGRARIFAKLPPKNPAMLPTDLRDATLVCRQAISRHSGGVDCWG